MSSHSEGSPEEADEAAQERYRWAVDLSMEHFERDDDEDHLIFADGLIHSANMDVFLALNSGQYEWDAMHKKLRRIEKAILKLYREVGQTPLDFEIETALDFSNIGLLGGPVSLQQVMREMEFQLFHVQPGETETAFERAVEKAKPKAREGIKGRIGRRNANVVRFLNSEWEKGGREVDQTWINTARTANLTPYLKYVHRGLQAAGIIECPDGEFDMPHLTAIFRHYRDYRSDFRI